MDATGHYSGVMAIKNGDPIKIDSQLIIGADGRYSTIRKQAQIDVQKQKHGFDLLWAKIPAPADWEPSIKWHSSMISSCHCLHKLVVIFK